MIQKAKLPLVGIRIPEWATFTRNIFAGVVDHMREHRRWHIETPLVTFSEMHPVRIDENWTGDGLIVFRYTPEEAESWMKRGVKVVNFSSECIDPRIPTVIPDNFESGRLAAIHLMGLGLKRFAFWEDPGRVYSRERLAGFSKELARNNFTCDVIGVLSCEMPLDRRADLVAAAMDRQLVKLPKPIGIFAKDDMAAMELIFSCQRLGITVPDEVAMIGCNDDFIFCYTADIPVSSVRYPARLIGYRAAAQLAALFGGATGLPARTIVPVEGVVVRELHGHSPVRPSARARGGGHHPPGNAEPPAARAGGARRHVRIQDVDTG